MHRFAAAAVSALGTVHAGFNRDEETIVDGFLDLSGEVNETVKVVARSEGVELVVSGRLRFCEHVEPEQRIYAILLLIGVGKHV